MSQKNENTKLQNEVSEGYFRSADFAVREQEVLADASKKSRFVPSKILGRSRWWGSTKVGAFHYAGTYQGKKAVIKIQGVKPNVSEIDMIESFARSSRSKVVRPPHLYTSLRWSDEMRYEALVLEFVHGAKIVQTPTTQIEVGRFFELYRDYRAHCLQTPWIEKPRETISDSIKRQFGRWRETSLKIYPNHPLRSEGDIGLIDQAVRVLIQGYQGVEPEFMHGHLSDSDFYQAGDQVIVLSNLYWSWRAPLYDAVFGYHWFMYHLSTVEGVTTQEVEAQRVMWRAEIDALPHAQGSENRRLLDLALLERATAGLNLDGLSADPCKPITKYLLESTREAIHELVGKLS